jgi:hypothetical protein
LDILEEKLFIEKDCQWMALVGLGGIGKTQVALRFAYKVKEQYPEYSICWVAALSEGTFEQAYTDVARKLGVKVSDKTKDIKQSLFRHLSSKDSGKWLLIVNNADDPDLVFGSGTGLGIIKHVLRTENGLVLLTTRSQEVAVDFAETHIVEIQAMDPDEATRFFERSLIQRNILDNQAPVTELLHILAHLPLAIAQAAAYINRTKTTVARYLQLLKGSESNMVQLLSQEFKDRSRYDGFHNSVARTWLVSFRQIQKSNETAVALLSFLSCIEPKAIPQSILPDYGSFETESAIGLLCGYSFLTRRGDSDTFDMHSLVHMAA